MSDERFMARCIELARRAEGRTAPNPMVGALIVRDGVIVGEGWHLRAGAEHAEVVALREAGEAARGADLYVCLEPCAHHGRTPPCVDAILAAGVRRVVAGVVDPNPVVNGAGIARLRSAGVEVRVGVMQAACEALNRPFFTTLLQARPLVVLKAAVTLDGLIATRDGESRWITGPESRAHVHALRDRVDAVMVGAGTACADDPHLDCRMEGGRDPLAVLLDPNLRVPHHARVFHGSRRALVFTREPSRAGEHPADLVGVPKAASGHGLDLRASLRVLVDRGVHTLLVEGGARVNRAFVEQGLVDRLLLFLAPKALGGGLSWLGGPALAHLHDAWSFEIVETRRLGADLLIELEPGPRLEPAVVAHAEGGSTCSPA